MAKARSEHDEQSYVFHWVRVFEGKHVKLRTVFATPNGGHRLPTAARKIKAEGARAGVWDILVCCPKYDNDGNVLFHGMFIEMKVGRNKLTDSQIIFRDNILAVSDKYKFITCYNWLDAVREISSYLDLPQEIIPLG